jgi:hypothetical protein
MGMEVTHTLEEGNLKLPIDFINVENEEVKEKHNLIEVLEFSIRDLDNITAKLFKDVTEKIEVIKLEIEDLKSSTFFNKYNFRMCDSKKTADAFYDQSENGIFYTSGKRLHMLTSEGEIATFSLTPDKKHFILTDEGMTSSNYGWVGEVYIKLARMFECDTVWKSVDECGDVDMTFIRFNTEAANMMVANQIKQLLKIAQIDNDKDKAAILEFVAA